MSKISSNRIENRLDWAIDSTLVNRYDIVVTLRNGVSFSVSSNPNHLHISMCNVKIPMLVSSSGGAPIKANNLADIHYSKLNDEDE